MSELYFNVNPFFPLLQFTHLTFVSGRSYQKSLTLSCLESQTRLFLVFYLFVVNKRKGNNKLMNDVERNRREFLLNADGFYRFSRFLFSSLFYFHVKSGAEVLCNFLRVDSSRPSRMTRTQFVNAHVQPELLFLVICHPKQYKIRAWKKTLISFESSTGSSGIKGQPSESFTLKKRMQLIPIFTSKSRFAWGALRQHFMNMNNIRNGPAINMHSFKTEPFISRCLAVWPNNNKTVLTFTNGSSNDDEKRAVVLGECKEELWKPIDFPACF